MEDDEKENGEMSIITKICRYCDKELSDDSCVITYSYWNTSKTKYYCHKECKLAGEKQEALDCQIIDSACNSCKFFKRGELIKKWLSSMVNGKSAKILVNMGIFNGHCLKFDKPVQTSPTNWEGLECFEHRRL